MVASCGSLPVALTVSGSAFTTLSVTSKCMTPRAPGARPCSLLTAAVSALVMSGEVGHDHLGGRRGVASPEVDVDLGLQGAVRELLRSDLAGGGLVDGLRFARIRAGVEPRDRCVAIVELLRRLLDGRALAADGSDRGGCGGRAGGRRFDERGPYRRQPAHGSVAGARLQPHEQSRRALRQHATTAARAHCARTSCSASVLETHHSHGAIQPVHSRPSGRASGAERSESLSRARPGRRRQTSRRTVGPEPPVRDLTQSRWPRR